MNKRSQRAPLLSVIILSVAADPLLLKAVASILEQDAPAEIIVVNSKGGNAAQLLRQAGFDVKVVESQNLLFAGGARNAGIAEATAPYIAFLACDCIAAPNWVSERLALHLAGHRVVASSVMPVRFLNLVSWADHLLLFPHRLPFLSNKKAILYGASFAREIFVKYGLFDPTLRSGEDTEFLQKLAPMHKAVWAPQVITRHHNKTNFFSLLVDQYARGRRFGIEMRRIKGTHPLNLVRFFLWHSLYAFKFARDGLRGKDRYMAYLSLPLVTLGCLGKALGIASMLHLVESIDTEKQAEQKIKLKTESAS